MYYFQKLQIHQRNYYHGVKDIQHIAMGAYSTFVIVELIKLYNFQSTWMIQKIHSIYIQKYFTLLHSSKLVNEVVIGKMDLKY